MGDTISVAALLGRLVISTVVVLALLGGAASLLRRRGVGSGARSRGNQIEVLSRRQLGRKASVALVRAGDRTFMLGVTESNVAVIGDVSLEDAEAAEPTPLWTEAAAAKLRPHLLNAFNAARTRLAAARGAQSRLAAARAASKAGQASTADTVIPFDVVQAAATAAARSGFASNEVHA